MHRYCLGGEWLNSSQVEKELEIMASPKLNASQG